MIKKLIKKGFTIVELVIIIAVIATLTAVLIPTFSNVIERANSNASFQEAKNTFTEIYGIDMADGYLDGKEQDTLIDLPSGVTWLAQDNENYEFSYTSKKGITWSYFCTNGEGQWAEGSCAHANKTSVPAKAATCTEYGLEAGEKCTDCQKTFQIQIPALGHDFGAWETTPQGDKEIRTCKRDNCGKTEERTTGHEHNYNSVVTNPTCTSGGYTTHTCSCGDSYTDSETSMKGHTPGSPVTENNVSSSCGVAGSYDSVVYCVDCSAEMSRINNSVPATGHNYGDWLTDTNKHWKQCSCGDKSREGNHNMVNGVCSDCGYGCSHTNTEPIQGKTATCQETGLTEGTRCTACQTIISAQNTIEKNPSNHTGSSVPGGTASAHTKYNCCGATISSTHTYNQDSGVKYSDATCKTKQKNYKSCSCGYNPKDVNNTVEVGSYSSDNHTGTTEWIITSTQHTQQYNCCEEAITTGDHNNVNGVCSVCGYEYLTIPFVDNFNSNTLDNNVWVQENKFTSDNFVGNIPNINNGVVTMKTKDSLAFKWTNLTSHNSTNTYVFEFDFKATNSGNGTLAVDGKTSLTRILYVSFGGWWSLFELSDLDDKISIANGDYKTEYMSSTHENVVLHMKVVLSGTKATMYVLDSNGNIIMSGSRTKNEFASSTDQYMPYLVLRCEDGSVEIDNFKFDVEVPQSGGGSGNGSGDGNGSPSGTLTTSSSTLSIANGKAATYSFTYNYQNNNGITVSVNSSEVLSLLSSGVSICGSKTNGSYTSGNYSITLVINPTNKILEVEIVLPTGRTIRRGLYSYVSESKTSYTVSIQSYDSSKIVDTSTSFESVSKESYTLTTDVPTYSEFELNVYNIITSFEDAATTRLFSFTAKTSYVDDDTMALGIRTKGEIEWNYVNAVQEEDVANLNENYYEVDVYNLSSSTTYEYKIGKLGGSEWSKTYEFTTASNNVDEFTFIAVGDTQGNDWSGTTTSTKGFMFAKAAYEQAIKDVNNPSFIIHTGDVVENGYVLEQWNYFFKAFNNIGTSIPHFATIGNHDYQNNTYVSGEYNFNLHFNHPNNGGMKALDSSIYNSLYSSDIKALNGVKESIYSYNYGDAHFVVLASGRYDLEFDEKLLKAQRAWLDADLKENASAKWKIVIYHEPVYHRVGGNEARPWLYDVIESNGVDLVIQGHSHLPTRTYPMKNGVISSPLSTDSITKGVGTVYTTIGSTAYNHDGLGNPNMEYLFSITSTANDLPTYAYITINNNKIVMTIKQIDGYIIDQFEIVNN